MTRLNKIALSLALVLGAAAPHFANASVVMTGTRVIYPAQAQEKVVQLTSQDSYPNLVQMWVDSGNPEATAQTAEAPFIVSPQVFRMNPNAGQVVRVVFTGSNLPKDRESLYYLSFLQVPAMKASELQANKLLLSVSSRMKLFYRPQGLAGDPENLSKSLDFKVQGQSITTNNSGYFAIVRNAQVVSQGKKQPLKTAEIVAPLSQAQWTLPAGTNARAGDSLQLTLVNDFGADVTTVVPLH
ncbi:fimbria/pilus periplasmic chaperone [Pseudomonas helleri]|uniref:fimbrial biogenesis chaperone n=1 Tax=Pseudomonas helleri TaxID=1608996 RepID=UPI0012963F58|nr:molecular chaperone [Pseudomonas helleri]MQU21359.1 fimbria/pilus periplasmic chaperone [Pseudomonas helleri]